MCGIGGFFSKNPELDTERHNAKTAKQRFDIYTLLSNRGAGSNGCVGTNGPEMNDFERIREQGSIAETLHTEEICSVLKGSNMNIFHTRFPTNGGEEDLSNVQPIIAYLSGDEIKIFDGGNGNQFSQDIFSGGNVLALAHNGEIRIPKSEDIFSNYGFEANIPENRSDSTLLAAYLLAAIKSTEGDMKKAMKLLHKEVAGAYSIVAVTDIKDVFKGAFAYSEGTHPLAIAETPDFFAVASETGHLTSAQIGISNVKLIASGALHTFAWSDELYGTLVHNTETITNRTNPSCFFEGPIYLQDVSSLCGGLPPQVFDKKFFHYLQNPEEISDYEPTKAAKMQASKPHTSKEIREILGQWFYMIRGRDIPEECTNITGVPKSGISFANGIAQESQENGNRKMRHEETMTINPLYMKANICPRDFLDSQKKRTKNDVPKFIFYEMPEQIMLCDDSIVTGLTLKKIITEVRQYGAKKIYVASASPPVIGSCISGVNMKDGHRMTNTIYPEEDYRALCKLVLDDLKNLEEGAAEFLGADNVLYMPLRAMELLLGPKYALSCVGGTAKCGTQVAL